MAGAAASSTTRAALLSMSPPPQAEQAGELHHRPEDQFLAGVEFVCRRVRAAREHAPALRQPREIGARRQIVPYPDDEHQDDADDEAEAREIVHVLAGERQS